MVQYFSKLVDFTHSGNDGAQPVGSTSKFQSAMARLNEDAA